MKNQKVKELNDRDWLLLRPHNIIGSVKPVKTSDFFMDEGKYNFTEYTYIPGFLKIINEILDNCIDVYVKSDGKYSNVISVDIDDESVHIKDNGYGIPVTKTDNDEWVPYVAWGKARSGTNFEDDENKGQIGMNGIGSFATVVFSKEFIGNSDDGTNKLKVTFKNNCESHLIRELTSSKPGVEVFFKPDLERFGLEKIDEIHKNLVYQRLLNLSVTYPEIKFSFNKKRINIKTKDYLGCFSDSYEVYEDKNYFIGVMSSKDDDFRFMSYVNGLHLKKGGSHVNYVLDKINVPIRERLRKKYKNIKPGDIKNKLQLVVFFKNLKNPTFDSQTKENLTNTNGEIGEFLGDIDWDKFTKKILKNNSIIDPIIEIYKFKEEFKKKQDLKNLSKAKKVKSEKYFKPIKKYKYLMICEGESARTGLMPILGRQEFGFYEMKGKPLNAYDSSVQKFTANKELSDLFQIINSEEYEYIIFATDQDLDGFTIRGLLLGFFQRYLPEFISEGKVGVLDTPIIALSKGDKIKHWYYSVNDVDESLYSNHSSTYYKGLGTWERDDLKYIIEQDGVESMIKIFESTGESESMIDDWLNGDKVKSDKRKEYIEGNEFDLIKL
ncbi:MAG: putative DNA topoisomerase II [uncultured marine phage]|uniref:DNA topoisomerase (ATP-hydrolyzing) n=1 Tax=uncultured marine phage TaxID=707152 RepID=A0A8D9C9G0_9VIRU|nr:MAG: putative DNA topoisomerase II [uncultured marine phage]